MTGEIMNFNDKVTAYIYGLKERPLLWYTTNDELVYQMEHFGRKHRVPLEKVLEQ